MGYVLTNVASTNTLITPLINVNPAVIIVKPVHLHNSASPVSHSITYSVMYASPIVLMAIIQVLLAIVCYALHPVKLVSLKCNVLLVRLAIS